MTTPATPKKTYSRPTKFPARLSTMLRQDQRNSIDGHIIRDGATLGEVTRGLLDLGLDLDVAYVRDPELRADIERIAKGAGAPIDEALATLLRYAVNESDRKLERHYRVVDAVAKAPSEPTLGGIEFGVQ